ncbi:hypothetical protein [Adlercreutzia agrestimuris]|uniref:hypothetical protein n=1 Tax=Adlercreutzia agrestimuris TaxID=2941324 RepID=UPI00203B9F3F|nr:hypothetical protein [Adlercreutzia agrestimuris]
MGNRAVITSTKKDLAVYLHWNGGRDTVEPLLTYCRLHGYRSPACDSYGYARLCQVMGNFFGGNNCIGLSVYTTDKAMDPGDNGIYVIDENWEIVERIGAPFIEQDVYPASEVIKTLDENMPEGERLLDHLYDC